MIRVVVADDQALMRTALEHFVAQAEDLEVVGSAEDGVQALEAARTLAPDVVLMDMQMPRMDGVEATARISAEAPGVRVLAITTFSSEQYLVPALRAGAAGYLVKDAPPAEVVDAIRRVHAGDAVFSARVAADLDTRMERLSDQVRQTDKDDDAAASWEDDGGPAFEDESDDDGPDGDAPGTSTG